ncbi:MAG TPA: hypothetical protein PLV06_11520 [Bacteroidales bacterium]|nr:hypothetical protein [Bacteroidales bacterium]
MKRSLISLVLFLNLIPWFLAAPFSAELAGELFAQGYGAKGRSKIVCECGGVTYTVPYSQGSALECPQCPQEIVIAPDPCPFCGQHPCVCGMVIDPCDPASEYYNECLCTGNNCVADVCDPTYHLYDPCACLGIGCGEKDPGSGSQYDCPCLTNLSSTPRGGILRNYAVKILHLLSGQTSGRLGYPVQYNFTYSDALTWLSDGSPVSLMQITGLSIDGEETDSRNYSYNCLGWVLTEGKFVFSTTQTKDVNGVLGISSVSDAVKSGLIKMSETCEGIQPGQICLLFDETNHYVHAAIYEGNGLYSTKNGLGLGEGVQHWTLHQIQEMYYQADAGAVKTGYINAPPRLVSTSSLGIDTEGLISAEDFAAAVENCECYPAP